MEPFVSWIASYPRSGNTWVRSLLLAYRQGTSFDLNRMEAIPGEPSPAFYRMLWPGIDPYEGEDWVHMRPLALRYMYETRKFNPFVLKTHTANLRLYGASLIPSVYTNKAVYIYRDPREVLLSNSKYLGKTHEEMLELMLADFYKLTDDAKGNWQFISSYRKHVKSWMNHNDFPVLGVRYSDLVKDPGGMLISILRFFDPDIEIDFERAKFAVKATSLGRLKKQEEEDGFREKPPEVGQFFGTSKDSWQEELDPDIADRLMDGIFKDD